jgi:general secretion pathway protein G
MNTGRARGFTLIELVITLAIIGLLATGAMPLAQIVAQREKEADLRSALREIRGALDAYRVAAQTGHIKMELGDSGFPPDLKALYEGVEDLASEKKVNLYFLRRIPRDPFFSDPNVPAEATWGLRSYASPADAPAPGEDVFDVYSLAPGKGLNGVAYRDW